MAETLLQRGERRHETCKFGTLTPAWQHSAIKGAQAAVVPLCTFAPEGPVPPALERAWGGIIDVDRDCAVCDRYTEITDK